MPYFVFGDEEDRFEESSRYGPGGLCPIKLGDILGPDPPRRYRVTAKLGWGAYATVWLARDRVAEKTVALKLVAAAESVDNNEATILKRLLTPEPLVLQLLDSFTVASPNGVHQVLVTEPVILLQSYLKLKLPGQEKMSKTIVRQLVEGVAFIHARGVAHGDLHPDNIGVALPDLDAFSETNIWELTCAPDIKPLVASDPERDPASFPPYLCTALDLGAFLMQDAPGFAERELRVRILDLGSAYLAEESESPSCITPLMYAPPEVVFPVVLDKCSAYHWDRHSDIWSLACTIHEIATGLPLFGSNSASGAVLNAALLASMATACGRAPEAWKEYLAANTDTVPPQEYTAQQADEFWEERDRWLTEAGTEDVPGIVALLRRMLHIDPKLRPSAEELLQDPYFNGLQDVGSERGSPEDRMFSGCNLN
ncbi:kinase-like domain-containing protein [Mycena crocata]|nr:kinase-like domain-containing protein [Mycena crocata]